MLRIHFLNVGHGDCTVIEHPSGRLTMVDINNGDEIDTDSHAEVLRELAPARLAGSGYEGTLGGLLGFLSPPSYGHGGLFQGAALSSLGGERSREGGLISGADGRPNPFSLGALLLGRDKKRELKEAGYSIALTNPIDFVLRQTPGHTIHRYIQTHPDLDHMRGLAALREHRVDIANFWDTQHDKVPDFRSNSDRDHVEWAEYQRLRSGRAGARCLTLHAGAVGQFWNRDPSGGGDHDGIEILTPTPEIVRRANGEENSNNLSYVLRLTYAGRSIILGGDAEEEVWRYLAQRHGARLKCDVLKASHHGRDSGYCADAVKLLSPTYTIVSVGKKPETDASNKYRAYSQRVWSTRWYGNLTLQVDAWGEIRWKAYPFEHGGTRC